MNVLRVFLLFTVILFGAIFAMVFFKGKNAVESPRDVEVIEVFPEKEEEGEVKVDRMDEFFSLNGKTLPIVETVTYHSRVPWKTGPAWIVDYARHYKTSRHFIARSLNGKVDYKSQTVKEGDSFNVLRSDVPFDFYLLIDLSSCTMRFYYRDFNADEAVLLKTYVVGVGRPDETCESGFRTPLGIYRLSSNVATYRPGMMGFYQGERVEMLSIFGTRWLPFGEEVLGCTAPAKGLGLHGLPCHVENGVLQQDLQGLGTSKSDGCVRLSSEDIEELYAILVSRNTIVEIVHGFQNAQGVACQVGRE